MLKKMHDPVLLLLHRGRENAQSARQLSAILGAKNPREITKAIERARANGLIVCASSCGSTGGYFFPASEFEATRYLNERRHREHTQMTATQAMQATLDLQRGQMTMWDDTENEPPLR